MGRVHGVSHSLAGIQAWLLHSITQNNVVPAFKEYIVKPWPQTLSLKTKTKGPWAG